MKQNIKEHILIRTTFGLVPIIVFAILLFFPDTQSGNSGIGINTSLFLGFLLLLLFGVFLLFETCKLFYNNRVKYVVSNIGIILFIGILYILELYLNHTLN